MANAKSVSARATSAMARRIVARNVPQALQKHGGGWVLDRNWGIQFPHWCGLTPHAGTKTADEVDELHDVPSVV